jgi:electron transfer flavoprotein alpha subunit
MVLVFIEVRNGKIKKSSLEVLSEGRRRAGDLGLETAAVVVGHKLEGLADEISPYGADRVYLLDNPLLSRYSPGGYAHVLADLAAEVNPAVFLFSAGAMGRDLAPRLAGRLDAGLASDCIATEVKDGEFEVVRPLFAGKALARFRFAGGIRVATLRPNVFPLLEPGSGGGEVIQRDAAVPETAVRDQVAEELREEGQEMDVTEADIIVAGGRGLKSPENFDLLRDLAALLPHAAIGASRSAVDAEWIDHQHQVGQTGKTVSPNLYLAFGISGAIQHLAGMSSSKTIVAVNKDPEAPIFKVADFGVVGDLFQVIPHLKDELKKIQAES